jgi:hypothetical protein
MDTAGHTITGYMWLRLAQTMLTETTDIETHHVAITEPIGIMIIGMETEITEKVEMTVIRIAEDANSKGFYSQGA